MPGEVHPRQAWYAKMPFHQFLVADSSQPDLLNSNPCKFVDLPQALMEPLFIKYATENGITCRFSTKLISVERKDGFIYSTVEDLVTKGVYQVKSRYIFGCDGGRSTVARSFNFKYESEPSGGVACNILLEADVGDVREESHQCPVALRDSGKS
jgi:2-polyprenyl-6-methoxyphenol hydroxylase-like FAD-dependent oxidoreductase